MVRERNEAVECAKAQEDEHQRILDLKDESIKDLKDQLQATTHAEDQHRLTAIERAYYERLKRDEEDKNELARAIEARKAAQRAAQKVTRLANQARRRALASQDDTCQGTSERPKRTRTPTRPGPRFLIRCTRGPVLTEQS
ncbi:unnamed protein product [Tilletia laevis]|nr:hypothetical protein CF336_g4932 [Tilletia laevis]KAE8199354.1 hypothetical protein CF335_g4191 [Tilletia laevis]KAE8260083.1 hypothetical protein A4X03_0g3919 [Tilletia caries]CAD6949403.1 unnamed protein product [Tilletia laevis]CAD7065966.1 unnamed protein product [Tilletia caries]